MPFHFILLCFMFIIPPTAWVTPYTLWLMPHAFLIVLAPVSVQFSINKISIYFYSSLIIPFTISLSLIIIILWFVLILCSCTNSAKLSFISYLLCPYPPYLSFSLSLMTYRNTSQDKGEYNLGTKHWTNTIRVQMALGAKGHLPRGYIEVTLRFFKQFTQKVSRGYMLGSFTMYPPLWSKCDQGSHAGHFYNVPTKVATGYFLNGSPGFFHNSPPQCVHHVSEPLVESSFIKYPAM